MKLTLAWFLAFAIGALSTLAAAEESAKPLIEFVHMGGHDCPPCRAWRATELPKLMALPEWKLIKYHHVTKTIMSPVPPAFWFPDEIKHLQPVLLAASHGVPGSPQQAIVVEGKVIDYWWGTSKGDAQELAKMFRAIQAGNPLPRKVCAELWGGSGPHALQVARLTMLNCCSVRPSRTVRRPARRVDTRREGRDPRSRGAEVPSRVRPRRGCFRTPGRP